MTAANTIPNFGIIGAGPSACYLTRALQRAFPGTEITIYEREEKPYGLINWGVAPDHQHTKAITRQFAGILQSPGVHLRTGCEIGKTESLAELRAKHTAVIVATGMWEDKPLPIPTPTSLPGTDGEGSLPIYGGGSILRTLNEYPGANPKLPNFGESPVIVGAGNVAMDVLRTLVKQGIPQVKLLSRSSGHAAKFDTQMLQEIARLGGISWHISLTEEDLASEEDALPRPAASRIRLLRELAETRAPQARTKVQLLFGTAPIAVAPGQETGLVVQTAPEKRKNPKCDHDQTTAPAHNEIAASSIITAIGFTPSPQKDPQLAEITKLPPDAKLPAGIYRVGWAATGPQGGIPATRQNAIACAELIKETLYND